MNDTSDTLPKPRRRSRKAAAHVPGPVPAVQAILDQALQAQEVAPDVDVEAPAPQVRPARKRRRGAAKGGTPTQPATGPTLEQAVETTASSVVLAAGPDEAATSPPLDQADAENGAATDEAGAHERDDHPSHPVDAADGPGPHAPPPDDGDRRSVVAPPPPATPHHWVYLAVAVFLLALGFGLWGVWTTFFASAEDDRSVAALRAGHEKLSQEVTILRRSDQISRDANRDLERTLAERDEEIAGLRADVAFYERFVGATGQRRGLSVHDLEMRLQSGEVWHFVATLTQNVNRGAVNSGRVTLSVEGTRNDRLERLSWSTLRKQNNAPGQPYSFKYFQQVEGEVMLPQGFKPLRVTVRLVPQGGSAVEQSFPWPDAVRSASAAD
jgi:hypothetical protein